MPGILDDELRVKITQCKVLVVGAGGIGCELLKNLVLTGFVDIETVYKAYIKLLVYVLPAFQFLRLSFSRHHYDYFHFITIN